MTRTVPDLRILGVSRIHMVLEVLTSLSGQISNKNIQFDFIRPPLFAELFLNSNLSKNRSPCFESGTTDKLNLLTLKNLVLSFKSLVCGTVCPAKHAGPFADPRAN